MTFKNIALLILILALSSPNLLAIDGIKRKNGSIVKCEIVSQDSTHVNIYIYRNGNRIETSILKNDIDEIIFDVKPVNDINTPYTPTIYKHLASINWGYSMPVGSFGVSDSKNAGNAKSGFSYLYIDYTYKYRPFWGICGKLFFNSNTIDTEQVLKILNQKNYSTWQLSPSSWKMGGFYAGTSLFYEVEKLQIGIKLMPGLIYAQSPELKFNLQSKPDQFTMQASNALAISYNIGVNLNFLLNKQWGYKIDFDYIGSSVNFSSLKSTSYSNTQTNFTGTHQNIQLLNISAGLFYVFNL
jgi:hypothetical protein